MVKCPFCGFDNEDGSLFCEQCKSDLGAVEPAPVIPVEPAAEVPMAAVLEEPPPMAVPLAEEVPMAALAVEAPAEAPIAVVEEPPPTPAPPAEAPAPPPPAPAVPPAPVAAAGAFAADAKPKLVVIRGQKIGAEFPIYPDLNFIGRSDEKPVDIDLEDQEPPDRIWCSRQHALLTFDNGNLTIEDLNSSNGTFVNRNRVYPGQKLALNVNDVIQIGTVQMKVTV